MRRKQILPDLHNQAKVLKNRKKLQHDGGRAWIKDSQLQEALKGGTYRIEAVLKNGTA